MILRGIHLEHWRCIEHLELTGLPAGVVVLHGPNRTGKSSLVRALRCCLYDYDHNTASKEFRKNVPWGGSLAPKVVVEFDAGQESYRLTKVFSTRADGAALLEKKVGERWNREEDSPREASRKTRELLGIDRPESGAGLNQLLWLDQGTVALPDSADLDGTLEKQLMSVLGVVVTGGDLAFKKLLDERWSRWFTPLGKQKEASPITRLERERERRLKILEEEEGKYREIEQVVRDLERCEDELPGLQQAVNQARAEAEALRAECEHSRRRRQEFEHAEREHQAALKGRQQAGQRLEALAEVQGRCTEGARGAEKAAAAVQAAVQAHEQVAREHGSCQQVTREARQAEESQQRARGEIDARRRLVQLAEQAVRLATTHQRLGACEQEIVDLERRLSGITAPEAKLVAELQRNRRDAAVLHAQLEAAALTLTVTLRAPAALGLRLDDQAVQTVELLAEEKKVWQLRQRAALELPGVGTVEVARSRENLDLEQTAQDLRKLERAFQEAMHTYGEDPADEACLERLAERRSRRQAWLERLKQVRQDATQLAPQGRAVHEAEMQELEGQRRAILDQRPDLADWQPHADDVAERDRAFAVQAERLKKQYRDAEAREKEAQKRADQAEKRVAAAREQLATAPATAQAVQEELQRCGEEAVLRSALQQAQEAVECAVRRLTETALTDAEKTVEERARVADNALRQREDRQRKLEDERNRLRGRLEGSEGLHIRRADAATAVCEVEQQLEHARLEAAAHDRLRTLFEHSRESQVQQVLGPIGDRVLDWARQLGLDYQAIRFGDRFLPDGFVPPHGATDTPLSLSEESYGTDEQLGLLVRLALGGVLAHEEPALAILDDPLAHADTVKHRRILEVLKAAAAGNPALTPPAGPLQILILTCHPERFDHLAEAHHVDLAQLIRRGP